MRKVDESKQYPLLPLRDVVVLPHMVIPLFVGREKSVKSLDEAMRGDRMIVLVTQTDPQVTSPEKKDLYEVGTVAEILQMLKLPNGTIKVLVEGITRVFVGDIADNGEFMEGSIRVIERSIDEGEDVSSLRRILIESFEKYIKTNKKVPAEALASVSGIDDLSHLCDAIASHVALRVDLKQSLVEIGNPVERVKSLVRLVEGELEVLDIEKKIHGQVRKQMEKSQRDYYLNEQMKVIKKELGSSDESSDEIEELRKSIEAANMPKEVFDKSMKELKRLEKMPPLSAESAVVRTYIEWLRDLPWSKTTTDNASIELARNVLNDDHYGLDEVKERILEFIAVRHLSQKIKGPILCFVGPPGVGKTSLGRSVAHALGREFVRISLGGVRDEAEIRGHRRTYVGSLPGKIIQAMKKAGTANPVILLDEVDKMSTDFRGDPSSALLEVLDPEQNHAFVDHYMEVPYDLSQVMFITTANVQHQIPLPLQDRMEIIEISSYTEPEKKNIAEKYLIPKQMKENGIEGKNVIFSEEMIFYIIRHYTRESGVRNLERTVGKICRKVACEVVTKGIDHQVILDKDVVHEFLGAIKFTHGEREKTSEVGLANGLAWTAVGGDVMQIEAMLIRGKGNLILTGKLGEVMQESAQAAFTYVKANQQFFNYEDNLFKSFDLHLHVPEGAIPKDGPSAGITMGVVIASLLSKIPVRCDVAMTGEITLRGKVLPIGGLKEKVLAAHRADITHIILPRDNAKDLEKIPEYVRNELHFHPVSTMEEVLFLTLANPEKFFKDTERAKELSDKLADKEFIERGCEGEVREQPRQTGN
jgi:ATP-dependent Lon protease